MPASFERVNYLTRQNKNIERKLVFDAIRELRGAVNVGTHEYLGFGSMWFVDLVLAHRYFGIGKMWSIERTEYTARANFNKPYDCIEVLPGDCNAVIKGFSDAMWQRPKLTWLDYDDPLSRDIADDVRMLIENSAETSYVIVSINANRQNYRPVTGAGKRQTALETLAKLLGATSIPPGHAEDQELPERDLPPVIAESVLNFMLGKMRTSGRQSGGEPLRFVPIFNFFHADGAPMITVGGLIASGATVARFSQLLTRITGVAPGEIPPQISLDLIHLTVKEKLTLDTVLPKTLGEYVRDATALGIQLTQAQVEKYRTFYLHYPIFTETLL